MSSDSLPLQNEMSVDELARRAGVPVRTIREYQTLGLLPGPRRRGRVGVYGASHLTRLHLIARLQRRGYSLAGIGDLLDSWRSGADIGEVLGLDPDQLVHVDEPGAPATADQLGLLLPELVPERITDLVDAGVVEPCEPHGYCVPSPSLLQLLRSCLDAGYPPEQALRLARAVTAGADAVAAVATAMLTRAPAGVAREQVVDLARRGRGLLAHATGRMTVHRIGRLLDEMTGDGDTAPVLRRRGEG
ncbi:MerR family transcriptional regulator [Pseudonocardia dioxanivorans]|uniref:MerR family transcriptional regulator n=1 Tax=Pseudonocardia dioxanivorans TaxID=240495 RepID=UPI000CD21A33|nr:MerR family transcriptional regulator [Pseudonocardia dioxanivorans]